MKKQLILLAFAVLSNMLYSQAKQMAFEEWRTTLGTQYHFEKTTVRTDASGNVYTAGSTIATNGLMDIYLTKNKFNGHFALE